MGRRLTGLLGAIGLVIGLAGCATPIWVKDGANAQDFEADKFDCEQKVVTMYGGYAQMGIGHAIAAGGDMKRCLYIKGYRQVSAQEMERDQQMEIARIRKENAARAAAVEAQRVADQTADPESVWRRKFEAAAEAEAAASSGKLNAKSVTPPCTASTPKDTPCRR